MVLLVIITPPLADGTAYLAPFLTGVAFIAVWAAQAVAAYLAARRGSPGGERVRRGSPAIAITLLGVPLLGWVGGFWLAGAGAASPGAVLDRFMDEWPAIAGDPVAAASLADDPERLSRDAARGIETLRRLCRAGAIDADCDGPLRDLARDLRFRLTPDGDGAAEAELEVVHFERRPIRFLGFIGGSELVAVADRSLLRLRLETRPGGRPLGVDLGARRWVIEESLVVR